MTECEHIAKGRQLAHVIADIASEREAARLTGQLALVEELEHSAAMTKLAMERNAQDHEKECTS